MFVVADTNIIISALLWGKTLEPFFALVNARQITLCFSPKTIHELLQVIRYPHIEKQVKKSGVPIHFLVDRLFAASCIVYPSQRVSEIEVDESDNRILETAIAARAEYIITGDAHLLRLNSYQGVPILKPRQFLERLKK